MKFSSKNIGIGSFSFRYHIGTKSFHPPKAMTVFDFIDQAYRLGYGCAQLYNNLNISEFDDPTCQKIKEKLQTYDMAVDLGLNGLTHKSLEKHLHIAQKMGARSLRVTIGEESRGKGDHSAVVEQAVRIVHDHLKRIEQSGVILCVENHFGLPSHVICSLVDQIHHPQIMCVCDTTNSIAFIERPEETLQKMGSRTYCLHIKDFVFEKPESGYFMNGAILGRGEQNTQGLIRKAIEWNPDVLVVLEMTIARNPAVDAEEVIKSELESVEASSRELFRILELIEKES